MGREREGNKPIVALPPNFISPNRRKGTERVVTPGTISRITITSSGFEGMSFSDILVVCVMLFSGGGCGGMFRTELVDVANIR